MKGIFIIILCLLFLGCSTSQEAVQKQRCPKIYQTKFTNILNAKYLSVSNNDTIAFNEIRFECLSSALYSGKVMFDKYGKWNKELYINNRNSPILMWKNIDLFSNGKKYTILTSGVEASGQIYSSVMVLDVNGKDIFQEQSDENTAVTNFFAELIKKQNVKKRDFYEVFWTTTDPQRWEEIKKMRITTDSIRRALRLRY